VKKRLSETKKSFRHRFSLLLRVNLFPNFQSANLSQAGGP